MKIKPIVIVGEPNSIFTEILKITKKYKFRSPIILICSKQILIKQSEVIKEKITFQELDKNNLNLKNIKLKN